MTAEVRLLVIADTDPELPAAVQDCVAEWGIDVVVCAGDLDRWLLEGLEKVDIPKVGVYGNHCDGKYFDKLGVVDLHVNRVVVGGIGFDGLQGCVRYKSGESDILYTQGQYREMLAGMKRVDVMVSHCPPAGINDHDDPAHLGIEALRQWIDQHHPAMLIHGHTYPSDPVRRHQQTRVEYVHGAKVIEIQPRRGSVLV